MTTPNPPENKGADALLDAVLDTARDLLKANVQDMPKIALFRLRPLLTEYDHLRASAADTSKASGPIPMLLFCSKCGLQHEDYGEWATKPHRTHRCEHCGNEWRPALVATVGIASLSDAAANVSFQGRVAPWMQECFGAAISADKMERSDRFIEESLELVQACGYDKDRAHALVEYVFGRPVGHAPQEVGGAMATLAALCLAHGFDMHAEGERELTRISAPDVIAKIRAKQASKPTGSALPIPAANMSDSAEESYEARIARIGCRCTRPDARCCAGDRGEVKRSCACDCHTPAPASGGEGVTPPARWRGRWEGSGPHRGWYIIEATRLHNNEAVAYLGALIPSDTVTAIVQAHNVALEAASRARTVAQGGKS